MIDRCCISLNNSCNLKCRYCHFHDKQKDISSFETIDIQIILDNIHAYCKVKNLPRFKIGFVGSGEPMIKKDVIFNTLDIVASKYYSELKIYTITNGTLLNRNDIEKFHKYQDIINVCFSLDGYEELHNYGRAKFCETMRSIETYKDVFGASPSVNATVNAISIHNKERLIDFFIKNDLLNVTFSRLVGYKNLDLYISDEDFSEFMQYIKKDGIRSRQFDNANTYDCTMYT